MRYVALLRAINVGGRSSVKMSDLREVVSGLGLREVQTLLQSGNLIFTGLRTAPTALERTLETGARKALGIKTDFFVRSADDWARVVSRNPFLNEAERDPGHLVVVFLKDAPPAASVAALQTAITGREVVQVIDSQLYAVYPDGIGRSRLTNAMIEKKLGTRGTARNWNTVLKVQALVNPS